MFDYSTDDDDDSDDYENDQAIDSDNDEVTSHAVSKKRFKYTTFETDNNMEDEHDNGKERALYGSFLENKSKRTSHPITTIAPMFVKQKSATNQKENDDEPKVKTEPQGLIPTEMLEIDKEKELQSILQKQSDDANARFFALLGRGKGDSRAKRALEHDSVDEMARFNVEATEDKEEFYTEVPSFAGLGASSSDMTFSDRFQQTPLPVPRDPNLGKWEKHTKGIGMKLLFKMGYKGSGGLGAKRNKTTVNGINVESKGGISKTIEVVVRPNNLGLGFGNFKEATKIKVNQQIEAEIRGTELPQEATATESVNKSNTSSLPSTNELMQQQSWKRGQVSLNRRQRVVSYKDLLKIQQQSTIIDMRGPAITIESSSKKIKQEVPLAEELLHNVSILLNTYENKLHSSSHFAESTRRKLNSLQSDLKEMDRRRKEGEERIAKMEQVMHIMSKVEVTLETAGPQEIVIDVIQEHIRELASLFSPEERTALKFDEVLVPSLLNPLVQAQLDQWNPMSDNAKKTERVVTSILQLCASIGDADVIAERQRSIFVRQVLPKIKEAFESTKWNPIENTDNGIVLYEAVLIALKKTERIETRHPQDDSNAVFTLELVEETMSLPDITKSVIMRDTVVPKLLRTMAQWKPEIDEGKILLDRLDLWILPWLAHLDYQSTLPELSNQIRRKIRSTLSYLKGQNMDDKDFLRISLTTLRPWKQIIDLGNLQNLTSNYVTSRLAKHISTLDITRTPKKQDWSMVDFACELVNVSLMTNREFLSLMEGEILNSWAKCLHSWIVSGDFIKHESLAELYFAWSDRLLQPSVVGHKVDTSCRLLRMDERVCLIFFTGLVMIQSSTRGNTVHLDNVRPIVSGYQGVLERRTREGHDQIEDELQKIQSNGIDYRKHVMSRRNRGTVTFREVVEDFAREQDFEFCPRMGTNSMVDGKQVFLFGDLLIYFDNNVVFTYQNTNWRPISLDELATIAKSQ